MVAGQDAVAMTSLRSWSPADALGFADQLGHMVTSFGVFRIVGEKAYVHELVTAPSEEADADQTPENGKSRAMCLVSGTMDTIARLHEPKIKGVTGAQSAGALLVSFNASAYESYGKSQSFNAPVSAGTAFKYANALNSLLDKRERRITLGDCTVVFWAEHTTAVFEDSLSELFGGMYVDESPTIEEDKERLRVARLLLTQLRDGTASAGIHPDDEPTKFFLLGLSPNASRISVRLWVEADAAELQRRLGQHLRDVALGYARVDGPLSLRSIVLATGRWDQKKARFDADNVSPQLAGELARAVFTGTAYPQSLLATMLRRIHGDGEVAYARVASIKACLLRNSRLRGNPMEAPDMLDTTNSEPAYCCGRAFALLEMIQKDSVEGELNKTIKDSYFSSASTTPALVFPRLCRLSQYHLAKLDTGLRIHRERQLGDVLTNLGIFPRLLSLEDQGKFVLGYFHQRQDLYTSKKPKEEGVSA